MLVTARRLDTPGTGIRLAEAVAEVTGVPLLILASKAANSRQYRPPGREVRVTVVDLDSGQALPTAARPPELITDTLNVSTYAGGGYTVGVPTTRGCDTPRKRNLALLHARLQGWQSLLMLDDDVLGSGTDGTDGELFALRNLTPALHALDDRDTRAVGWRFTDFPDNSSVCHARSLAGFDQEQFVGGGALLVKITDDLPFFPPVYNEDWLFLLPLMLRGRSVVRDGGTLRQQPYRPFGRPRVMAQELGDVFGETLFAWAAQAPTRLDEAHRPGFWASALADRRAMLAETRTRLLDLPDVPDVHGRRPSAALEALAVAKEVHRTSHDWATELATFYTAYVRDLERWCDWWSTALPA